VAEPVANVDDRGRSMVKVPLSTGANAHMRACVVRLVAVICSVIESQPIDAA
jgi:hypothetical protein